MMAGAYIGYNMEIDEVVSRKPIGVVDEIQLDIQTAAVTEELPPLDPD